MSSTKSPSESARSVQRGGGVNGRRTHGAKRAWPAYVDEQAIPLMREAFEQHHLSRKSWFRKLQNLAYWAVRLEGYDCAGMNSICYGLICQELERADSGLRSFVSVQSSLVMYPDSMPTARKNRKQRWLPAMAKGEAIGCFGLTEPHGGSDPSNMKTHAKKDGDDWILNGSKMWITNATVADAAVVWARTDEGVKGFIVEKDMPGFTTQEIENKFSLTCIHYRRAVLRQCTRTRGQRIARCEQPRKVR